MHREFVFRKFYVYFMFQLKRRWNKSFVMFVRNMNASEKYFYFNRIFYNWSYRQISLSLIQFTISSQTEKTSNKFVCRIQRKIYAHEIKKCPAFFDNEISLPHSRLPINGPHSTSLKTISLRFVLILSSLLRVSLPSSFFLLGLSTNILYALSQKPDLCYLITTIQFKILSQDYNSYLCRTTAIWAILFMIHLFISSTSRLL
jgi:hypothetical protein